MPFIVVLLIATLWGIWMSKRPLSAFAALIFALPTYTLRYSIGGIPTTMLECIVLMTIIGWFFFGKEPARNQAEFVVERFVKTLYASRRFWWVLGSWIFAGAISIFVASDMLGALGLYRAYFIEPVLLFMIGCGIIHQQSTIHAERHRWSWAPPILQAILLKKKPKIEEWFSKITNRERKNLGQYLLRNAAVLLIILGGWSIVQMLTGWGIPHPWNLEEGRRAVGPFPFPNALALFSAPLITLIVSDQFKLGKTRFLSPVLAWLAVISGTLSILLVKSDGGLAAILGGIAIAALIQKRTRIPAIVGGVLVISSVLLLAPVRERVLTVVLFKEWSSKVRLVMWDETITMLKDRPVFGAGLGGYPDAIKPYHQATWMEIFQYPHNILLNLWSELGLIGISAFLILIATWVVQKQNKHIILFKKKVPHFTILLPAIPVLATILIHGLVDVPYFKNDLAILFWMLILITLSYEHSENRC